MVEGKKSQFDQASERERAQAQERFSCIRPFLESSVSLTQLAQEQGLPLRTLSRWVQAYREAGMDGLLRKVRSDKGERRGIPSELKQLIEALAVQHPRSIAAIHRQVEHIAKKQGLPLPSYSQVYAIINALDVAPTIPMHKDSSLQLLQAEDASFIPPGSSIEHTLHPPSALSHPLLTSRLAPPRLPALLVNRTRLLALLDVSLFYKLTLLQAPAGAGKTTAVNQWIAAHRADATFPAVAWVSLDTGDNDPFRFWRVVIAACQSIDGHLGRTPLAFLTSALQPPFEAPPLDMALTHLLNDLTQQVSGGLLILDDYHTINDPRIHESIAFFIDHLPTTWHVLLLSRAEPALPLLRWRARGDLYELHTIDMRFSLEETALFFRKTLALPLSEVVLTQLHALLEGWVAGLRLFSLALQKQKTLQEIESYLVSLNDHSHHPSLHQPLLDYLMAEVFETQPEPYQRFLLQTSMLNRLNGPLCDVVTGGKDSTQVLETMERAGLFLEVLNDGEASEPWYRYQTLWAEALRREASRRQVQYFQPDGSSYFMSGDEALRVLSLRASYWYEQHARPWEAIDAALLAHEEERAALLIEQADATSYTYEPQVLYRWLSQLSPMVLHAHPLLCLLMALVLQFHGESTISNATQKRIETLLQEAEEGWQRAEYSSGSGLINAFRAMCAWRRKPLSRATEYAQKALTLLSQDSQDHRVQEWRRMCQFIVGVGYMQAGHFDVAQQIVQEAHKHNLDDGDRNIEFGMILMLGTSRYVQGELHQAAAHYRRLLSMVCEREDKEYHAYALLGLAGLSLEWNDLATVEQLIHEALMFSSEREGDIHDRAAFHIALLNAAQGRTGIAQKQLAELVSRLQTISTPEATWLLPAALTWHARLLLAMGDQQSVLRCIEMLERILPESDVVQHIITQTLRARLLLAQGDAHAALLHLETLHSLAWERGQMYAALEIQILLALAHIACKQPQMAHRWILQTLAQAQSEGFIRLFLDEGKLLVRLLRQVIPAIQGKALRTYAQDILHAFTQTGEGHPSPVSLDDIVTEPLSKQELCVLKLLIAGYSNQQIAQELVISINTVKTHVKHIYSKLGVSNRIQAIDVARNLIENGRC